MKTKMTNLRKHADSSIKDYTTGTSTATKDNWRQRANSKPLVVTRKVHYA